MRTWEERIRWREEYAVKLSCYLGFNGQCREAFTFYARCLGNHPPPSGFAVSLQIDDPMKAERIFGELSEGGTVQMPIAETFFSTRFGMLIDRFGTPWMINCEKALTGTR